MPVRNGTGKVFAHNHQSEFRTVYTDPETGEVKSAWEIIAENTDRRYVSLQLDTAWAADAGVDVAALIREYGKRIDLLRIKDVVNFADPATNGTPVYLGTRGMDFEPILAAARKANVRYYIVEQDPPFTPGSTFDPFVAAQHGIDYLTSVRF